MTNSQHQAAYRERAKTNGLRRLNTHLSAGAKASLERLATWHGGTQRAVLERVLKALAGDRSSL